MALSHLVIQEVQSCYFLLSLKHPFHSVHRSVYLIYIWVIVGLSLLLWITPLRGHWVIFCQQLRTDVLIHIQMWHMHVFYTMFIYTIWPRVYGHLTITSKNVFEHSIPDFFALWGFVRICANSVTTVLVSSGIYSRWGGLEWSQCSGSCQKSSVGLRSGGTSTQNLPNSIVMDHELCTGALTCWNRFALLSSSEKKL